MATIDLNFHQSPIENSDSSQFLVDVLNKLNVALDKISSATTKTTSNPKINPKDTIFTSNNDPFKDITHSFENAVNEFNNASEKALKDLGNKIGSVLGTATTISIARYLNNEANAVMNRASAHGGFIAQSIGGNANQAFGNYVSSLFDIERQRKITENNIIAEGVGGAVGGIASAVGGTLKDTKLPIIGGIGSALEKGGLGVAAIGASSGKLTVAKMTNQQIEQQMLAEGARAKLFAEASISQWKTGFSRFGLEMTNTQLVNPAISGTQNGISVPLQSEFINKYGKSQNFKAIQENIVPYLNTNPLESKTGNLDKFAQQLLKAGFSISEFGRLTMQSSQYTAITGKKQVELGDEISRARNKFGDAFDVSTNQTALNLMSLGYSENKAQSLAYQSKFNPGIANNISMLSNTSYSDYYRRQVIGNITGININKSLAQNELITTSEETKKQVLKEIKDVREGKSPSIRLEQLRQSGIDIDTLSYLAQEKIPEGKLTEKQQQDINNPDFSPAQQNAFKSGTVENLLSNVQNMTVTSTNVTVINNGGNLSQNEMILPIISTSLADKVNSTKVPAIKIRPSDPSKY